MDLMDGEGPGNRQGAAWDSIEQRFMFCWSTCSVLVTANSLRAAAARTAASKPCGLSPLSSRPAGAFRSRQASGAIDRSVAISAQASAPASNTAPRPTDGVDGAPATAGPTAQAEEAAPLPRRSLGGARSICSLGLDRQVSSDSQWARLALCEAQFEGKVIGRPVELEGLAEEPEAAEEESTAQVALTVLEGGRVEVRVEVKAGSPVPWAQDSPGSMYGGVVLPTLERHHERVESFDFSAEMGSRSAGSPPEGGKACGSSRSGDELLISLMADDVLASLPAYSRTAAPGASSDADGVSFSFDCSDGSLGAMACAASDDPPHADKRWIPARDHPFAMRPQGDPPPAPAFHVDGVNGWLPVVSECSPKSGSEARGPRAGSGPVGSDGKCGWERDCQDSARALMPFRRESMDREGDVVMRAKGRPRRGRPPASVCSEESWASFTPSKFLARMLCGGGRHHNELESSQSLARGRPKGGGGGRIGRYLLGRFLCRQRLPNDD